jgi:hypothetical protein
MWAIEQWDSTKGRWVLYTAPREYVTRFKTCLQADVYADQNIVGVYRVVYREQSVAQDGTVSF